jgi:quinohemoprotein ethanol dehydrogenase
MIVNRILLLLGVVFLVVGVRLEAAETSTSHLPRADWPVLGGNSDVWHYSPLDQINSRNVASLGLAWSADLPIIDGLVGDPLVIDGVIYQGGPAGQIFANDARTGKELWTFRPQLKLDESNSFASLWAMHHNRGVAADADNVYIASGNCLLFAVDRHTGRQKWESVSCDPTKGYGIAQAPRVGDGKVFIGNACADTGADRGFVDAFDGNTGKHIWRFYTMPGDPTKPFENKAMEMASKTWGTGYWEKTHGCVSPWDALTYDAKLNLLYIGTGSTSPQDPTKRAPDAGDELFTNSIVAVNATTGEYVWHFQTMQHDGWLSHATMHIMIAELPVEGKRRRVVMTAPKNGFFYVMDAKTGRFLSANNYTPITWASGVNPKTGRPATLSGARYWEHPTKDTVVLPGSLGAHSWEAMAFDPAYQLVYIPVSIIPELYSENKDRCYGFKENYFGLCGDPKWKVGGKLVAWNPVTQKERWHADRALPLNGGILATAGNLVFQATASKTLEAFTADRGRRLWSYDMKGIVMAAPTTVQLDGKQYIFVPSGDAGASASARLPRLIGSTDEHSPSRLLAFALGGIATLPAAPRKIFSEPPRPRPDPQLARKGSGVYAETGCIVCHGVDAINGGRAIPDLRQASAAVHANFANIVRGLYVPLGMPGFKELHDDEIDALEAFIIDQAWNAYDGQKRSMQ